MTTKWNGETVCSICRTEPEKVLYDAQTKSGLWAVLCQRCFSAYGIGLGTGKGQKYEKQPDGQFVKVA
jgi:hypothetical protein